MLNRKGDIGVGVILLVLIVLIFLSVWGASSSVECNSNKDCGDESYCGSDFACHNMPVIEKEVVKRSYTLPVLIVCLTAIIIAVIFKWEKIFRGEKVKQDTVKKKDLPESYYSSQFQYTAK
ncbi:MAG: hypothetical protein U9O94_02560 [Nanoarchaeota archaeon]|nr:hypothetical protein [Nanoarchaeota archaeon]